MSLRICSFDVLGLSITKAQTCSTTSLKTGVIELRTLEMDEGSGFQLALQLRGVGRHYFQIKHRSVLLGDRMKVSKRKI